MGRNGAGKSTLLRLMKGLVEPTRGRVDCAGAVALLLQNPGDYLLHEHAEEEAGPEALARAGLAGRGEANPRDLSGGERQRLALEVVLAGQPVRGGAARRAHQGNGPRAPGRARGPLLRAGRRGCRGDGGHARHRVRRHVRRSGRAARPGRGDRGRVARRGARRRAGTSRRTWHASPTAPRSRPRRAPGCCATGSRRRWRELGALLVRAAGAGRGGRARVVRARAPVVARACAGGGAGRAGRGGPARLRRDPRTSSPPPTSCCSAATRWARLPGSPWGRSRRSCRTSSSRRDPGRSGRWPAWGAGGGGRARSSRGP